MRHWAALGLVVLLASISIGAQPAHAGLRFCNQANFKFSVAFGYVDREKGWVGKGWSVIDGGQCKDAIPAALSNRYYYFYAVGRGPDGALVKYNGETPFCIQSQKFLIYQAEYGKNSQEECSRAGLRSEMFTKIDTQGKPDWTINLRGPDGAQGASAAPAPRPMPTPMPMPPANQAPPPPSAAPGGGGGSAACQRYPNLC